MEKTTLESFLVMKPNRSIMGKCQLKLKNPTLLDLERMLDSFRENVTLRHIGNEPISKKSADNYCTWLRKLDKACNGEVLSWILDGLSASNVSWEREQIAWRHFEDFVKNIQWNNSEKSNVRSAYRKFVKFVMGYFDGNLSVSFVLEDFLLADLVARTAMFASCEVVEKVKKGELGSRENKKAGGNQYASWDCMKSKRGHSYEKKGSVCNGITIDDNTRANKTIKQAVLETLGIYGAAATKMFTGFEACHIWGDAHDEKYYQSIMNLVLVPRSLAALTDHNQYVIDVLTYKVFELYGPLPLPAGMPQPAKPKDYDKIQWRKI